MAYLFDDNKSKIPVGKATGNTTIAANSEATLNVTSTIAQYADLDKIHVIALKQCIEPSSGTSREWVNANGIKNSSGDTFPRADLVGVTNPRAIQGITQKFRIKLYNNTNESRTVRYVLLYTIM